VKWIYGVTTVLSRKADLFPRTLASLRAGGFDKPRLFIDGCTVEQAADYRDGFGLEVVCRWPVIRTYGNWILGVWELYLRDPTADRYAMFQDDLVTYTNLRSYLEVCPYPSQGYWNLYTFPSNQDLCPRNDKGKEIVGWYESNQWGRGAVGLVFSRPALVTLLSQTHMVNRVQDCARGYKSIDGGIIESMKNIGWKEYVHFPSLLQHRGDVSARGGPIQKHAPSFRGENFDALELLAKG
jgi:hypothetical protein